MISRHLDFYRTFYANNPLCSIGIVATWAIIVVILFAGLLACSEARKRKTRSKRAWLKDRESNIRAKNAEAAAKVETDRIELEARSAISTSMISALHTRSIVRIPSHYAPGATLRIEIAIRNSRALRDFAITHHGIDIVSKPSGFDFIPSDRDSFSTNKNERSDTVIILNYKYEEHQFAWMNTRQPHAYMYLKKLTIVTNFGNITLPDEALVLS